MRTTAAQARRQTRNRSRTGVDAGGPTNTADRIAWFSLHALVGLVPLATANLTMSAWVKPDGLFGGLPFTYDQFDLAKVFVLRFCTLVAILAWGWGSLTRGGELRRIPQGTLVLASIAWVSLSTVLSIHTATALFGKYHRFEGLISFVNYALVLYLTVQYADRPSRVRSLARTLVIAAGLVSLYGVMQFLGLDPIVWQSLPFDSRRAFSTYGNPDLLAGFLMFVLPISLALALSENHDKWRLTYWILFLLAVVCWFVTFVRGAWIGGLVGLLVMGCAVWRSSARLKRVDKTVAASLIAVLLVFGALSLRSPNESTNVAKRAASILDFKSGSAETRTQLWQAAIAAIRDRPVLGFGLDTFRLVFPRFKPAGYVASAGYRSVGDNVHNYPLQLAAAVGLPGFVLLYGLFVWALVVSFPSAFREHAPADGLVYSALWASVVAYLAHLMFGVSVPGSTVFLWLSLGISLAPFARLREFRAPSWGRAAAVALAAVTALGLAGNFVYVRADRYYLFARARDSGPRRVEDVQRAIDLNPFNDVYRSELGLAYRDLTFNYLGEASRLSQAGQSQQAVQISRAALESFLRAEAAMKAAIDFVPGEYDNYVFLASTYNLGGQYFDPKHWQDAIAVAQRGIEVEPHGPGIRYQQALAYASTGEYAKALAQLEIAADLDPSYGDAIALSGDIYRQTHRLTEAKAAYEKALRLDLGSRKSQIEQALSTIEGILSPGKR